MQAQHEYSAIITKGQVAYVAYCRELGVASQGKTRSEALKNLKEAVELYLEETADSKIAKTPKPVVATFTA